MRLLLSPLQPAFDCNESRRPYASFQGDDRARVDHALGFLGLEALADRILDTLFGGQRQRTYVAMELRQDMDYVLFDEPLNNLGTMKLLRQAVDELGKTIVPVLHGITFSSHYSDDIVAMHDASITRQGTRAEIMTSGIIQEVYDMDVEIQDIRGRNISIY